MTPDALPTFGQDGEPCPSCHAPLAANQRYCLYCGTRRPEARLEFIEAFAVDAAVPGTSVMAPPRLQTFETGPEPGLNGWLKARSGLLGLAGLLAITLLIGLLLGHWASGSDQPQAAAAAPQVIRVAGGAAPADTAATDAAATDDTTASSKKKKKAKKASSSDDDAAAAVTPKVAVAASKVTSLKGKAKDKALGDLAKKGKGLATGGTPPPKDNKAAGGGSSFEEIG